MPDGILDAIEVAGTVVLATPPALLGMLLASQGDLLGGGAFLAIAAGMIALEAYVLSARDVVAALATRLFGADADRTDAEEGRRP